MSYSHYTNLQTVRQKLGIIVRFESLGLAGTPLQPSDLLLRILERNTHKRTAYFNEKSRSEGIVFPILAELQHHHQFKFALYSGANMEGDKKLGLNGECDFVLSSAEQSIELERPVCCIVEAKDNDLELGMPQCIAQLCGAKLFNQKTNLAAPTTLYGAVTTGTEWIFLQLHHNTVVIDTDWYGIKNLAELLGVLDKIIKLFFK